MTIGAIGDGDIPSTEPPEFWGLTIRGPNSRDFFTAGVRGKYRAANPETWISILRPNGTYWVVP